MTISKGADGLYDVPIIQLGERLRDNFGLRIREHSAFGDGKVGGHAPNSYHYHDEAIDVTDFRPDVIDGVDWTTRTGNLQNLLSGSGAEIIGPNSGDPNHSTHLHLAAKDGIFKLDQNQYDTLFGGGAGGRNATFAGFTAAKPGDAVDPPGSTADDGNKRADAKSRAQSYADMSKTQLDAEYDKLRNSDRNTARDEGMKMHKAFFNKP